jgi:hypothetical protein
MAQVSTDRIENRIAELILEADALVYASQQATDSRDGGHGEYDAAQMRRYAAKVLEEFLDGR